MTVPSAWATRKRVLDEGTQRTDVHRELEIRPYDTPIKGSTKDPIEWKDVPVCSTCNTYLISDLFITKRYEARSGIDRRGIDEPYQTMSPVLNPIMMSIRSGEAVAGLTSWHVG